MKFEGKVAMITGASVGIGRAVALKMAEEGARLILLDINGEKLMSVCDEVRQYGAEVKGYPCDVSDEAAVKDAVEDALAQFGKIDILVNNAALWRDTGPFGEVSSATWRKYMDINVLGTVNCTQAALPGMVERGYGRIINVASVAGVYGLAGMTHYSATKGAVIAFTKALAKEVTEKGVLVNSVSPGSVSPSDNEDVNFHRPSRWPYMGRTGTDAENANLICFLASDEASYMAGANILIDGCRKQI